MLAERIRQMESDIERIGGVEQVRMRVQEGEISEVHVIADRSRRPKWIARDVISTLFTRHGVRIPHQRISIVSAGPLAGRRDRYKAQDRKLKLSRMTLTIADHRLQSTIEIADGERTFSGSSEGIMTRGNRNRIVGEATLDALRRLTSGNAGLHLEEARIVRIGHALAALVHVSCVLPTGRRSLVSCCRVAGSPGEAVACAILRAVGRILSETPREEEEVEYLIEDKEEHSDE